MAFPNTGATKAVCGGDVIAGCEHTQSLQWPIVTVAAYLPILVGLLGNGAPHTSPDLSLGNAARRDSYPVLGSSMGHTFLSNRGRAPSRKKKKASGARDRGPLSFAWRYPDKDSKLCAQAHT
jgi:hypothetical protein